LSEFYHGSARAGRDEFISLPTVLQQSAALTSIGDRPLIVVTAVAEADPGWVVAQETWLGCSRRPHPSGRPTDQNVDRGLHAVM